LNEVFDNAEAAFASSMTIHGSFSGLFFNFALAVALAPWKTYSTLKKVAWDI
jgi:hypothetical protein